MKVSSFFFTSFLLLFLFFFFCFFFHFPPSAFINLSLLSIHLIIIYFKSLFVSKLNGASLIVGRFGGGRIFQRFKNVSKKSSVVPLLNLPPSSFLFSPPFSLPPSVLHYLFPSFLHLLLQHSNTHYHFSIITFTSFVTSPSLLCVPSVNKHSLHWRLSMSRHTSSTTKCFFDASEKLFLIKTKYWNDAANSLFMKFF